MQRASTLLFCALVLAALGYVMAHAYARHSRSTTSTPLAVQSATTSATATAPAPDAGVGPEADAGRPVEPSELERILGGGEVPPLPNSAPRSVDVGVILFTHNEAQFAPKGARSKDDAHRLAKELIPEAEENFKEAAKKADPGSTDDAGTIPRGVLEPQLEYVIYTLEKGVVFQEPLDAPRGYWIVKRIR